MKKIILLLAILVGSSISILAQSGKITGKLTYPGEGIPTDLVLCVTVASNDAQPTYCSNNSSAKLRQAQIVFRLNFRGASYSVDLPAGSYYIYARTGEMPGVKAYYDEFIRCGMNANCTSKTPIILRVKAGQTKTGVTVGDFW